MREEVLLSTDLEKELVEKGYWEWSTGDAKNPPMCNNTGKWNKMVKTLFAAHPMQMITEKMIWNYIQEL